MRSAFGGTSVNTQRDAWGTRLGLVMAAAGNAIGIGNLLRFPAQAANNGGGAFMIPYFVSLLLLGIPMMWVLWTIGRYGGRFGHSTTPGMFDKMWAHPIAKHLGAIGVSLPLLFCFYYTYIESWCLGYAWFSLTGDYLDKNTVDLATYLAEFQGASPTGTYFPTIGTAIVFLFITVALNVWVLYRGVSAGIEKLALFAMPLLVLFCIIMTVRVFTLDTVHGSVTDGLAFLYTPDFSKLSSFGTWLAAAGQIFFTLSIGFGTLECYASYVRPTDDIALTALTTASTNEFVEVIFGSSIAIPAAAVFFGAAAVPLIAQSGPFNIGMVSMPEVLRSFPAPQFFGAVWFLLLFFAAFTSSVGVCLPVVAFLQDEFKLPRAGAALLVGMVWIMGGLMVAFGLKYGFLGELDFWAGTVGLVVFSAIEVILFAWIFGMTRGWEELHQGAKIRVPKVFRHIIRYVTPVALLLILAGWIYSDVIKGGVLAVKPTLVSGIVERSRYPGAFGESAAGDEVARAAVTGFEDAVKGAVGAARRDLKLWLDVELAAEGGVTIHAVDGDPALTRVVSAERARDWFLGKRASYRENDAPKTVRYRLAMEGLYTAPWIWTARALIVMFVLGFFALTAIAWRGHRERQAAGGAT